MYLKATTLDDLLVKVYSQLLKSKVRLKASKGWNVELSGVSLELTKPRARLSRTQVKGHIFSCLGELIWYLSGSNRVEPMTYYLSGYSRFAQRNGVVWGAYGPRIFGDTPSQYDVVLNTLRKKKTSRQAVFQLFDKRDIRKNYKDVPCTCTLQFLQRDGMLHLIVHMRSNDAYLGLPHDVFSFTMLQEIVANELGYKIGSYKHLVGSLHLYDEHRDGAARFLAEGVQRTQPMPAMSTGSQQADIAQVKVIEEAIRTNGPSSIPVETTIATLSPFWGDMVRLLAIFSLTKDIPEAAPDGVRTDRLRRVVELQAGLSNSYYKTYIRRRSQRMEVAEQLNLINPPSVEQEEER
ncbi:thymidylate synthase [Brevundimonas sp.]|uniref:thymidylate synthase n=1 Tax=Brevundimonas sp. TaxID=1871086 RepID=UPI002BA39D62|nr:thymidylate synthase [Brevundimonas sp.]HWQ85819.1 thymidylate synthase [Brevundimonas sp.]